MNFDLKLDIEDAHQLLLDKGYEENAFGKSKPVELNGDIVEAIKIFPDNIAVAVTIVKDKVELDVYRFRGSAHMHKRISGVRAYKQYVEDIDIIWR